MGSQQIIGLLLAMRAETKAWREEKTAMREMMDASHKEIVAEIKPEIDVKTMACREAEACGQEA
jgi:hypothetical protein